MLAPAVTLPRWRSGQVRSPGRHRAWLGRGKRGGCRAWALTVVLVLGSVGHARAQAGPPAAVEPVRLEPVVVTATRTEVPLQHLSTSASVITREEIEARRTTDVNDLLRIVPGVNVNLASPAIRGGSESYNLILVDGVKVNDSLVFGAVGILGTHNVDRIEIVRSPYSALYGPDAMSSVIQTFTRRGYGEPRAEVSVGAGNRDALEESATLSGGVGPFGYSLGVERIDEDGNLRVNSGVHITRLSTRLDFTAEKLLDVTLSLRYIDALANLATIGPDRFQVLDPHQSVRQERLILSGRASHFLEPWWQQALQLGFFGFGFALNDPVDQGIADVGLESRTTERRFSADYSWTFTPPKIVDVSSLLTVGVAYEHEEFDQAARLPVIRFQPVSARRDTVAGYSQAQLDWRKALFVNAGLRVDDSSVFGLEVTRRASAAYIVPVIETKVRAAYGEGIKAPTFVQLFGSGTPFVTGNPNLGPERSRSWEIGLDQPLHRDAMRLSATYFETRFDDQIVFLGGGSPSYQSIGAAKATGLEFAATLRPVSSLTVGGAYTLLDTKILDNRGVTPTELPNGAPLLRRPRHTGSLWVDHVWERLHSNVVAVFVGDSEDVDSRFAPMPRVRLPGYTRLDASMSWLLLKDWGRVHELTMFGRGRNLSDERFEEFFGFSADRRNFVLGLKATF